MKQMKAYENKYIKNCQYLFKNTRNPKKGRYAYNQLFKMMIIH